MIIWYVSDGHVTALQEAYAIYNAIREAVQEGIITVKHVAVNESPADIFIKEDTGENHYLHVRNTIVSPPKLVRTIVYLHVRC